MSPRDSRTKAEIAAQNSKNRLGSKWSKEQHRKYRKTMQARYNYKFKGEPEQEPIKRGRGGVIGRKWSAAQHKNFSRTMRLRKQAGLGRSGSLKDVAAPVAANTPSEAIVLLRLAEKRIMKREKPTYGELLALLALKILTTEE